MLMGISQRLIFRFTAFIYHFLRLQRHHVAKCSKDVVTVSGLVCTDSIY